MSRYHQHLARKLNELAKSDDINIADILHLVGWVETTYEPYLQRQSASYAASACVLRSLMRCRDDGAAAAAYHVPGIAYSIL